MIRRASNDCRDSIKGFEDEAGFLRGKCSRLTAYLCPAGVWTIGWGHTEGVHEGMIISAAQADEDLEVDLHEVELRLSAILPPTIVFTQHQFDALCSLCFNLAGGPPALPQKAPHLWRDLLDGKIPEAAHEFLDMDHALVNGKPVELPGLKRRRQAEAALFLS